MEINPPANLAPFEVLFEKSEPNAALPPQLANFVGNIGFPSAPPDRPWIFANFVQSVDGLVSFGGDRPGGEWISRSRHDRWMMDLLRAHADAVLCGVGTLLTEAQYGKIPGGPVYRIVAEELGRLRNERLQRGKLKNLIVTGSAKIRAVDYRIFRSEHVEAWIVTTPEGRRNLGDAEGLRVMVSGSGNRIDWNDLLPRLRSEHGIEYLLCEGGPTLYGDLLRGDFIDEKFLTISPQEIGAGLPDSGDDHGKKTRPTSVAGPGFSPVTARWYKWLSCRKAGEHEFNRYRRTREGAPEPPPPTS